MPFASGTRSKQRPLTKYLMHKSHLRRKKAWATFPTSFLIGQRAFERQRWKRQQWKKADTRLGKAKLTKQRPVANWYERSQCWELSMTLSMTWRWRLSKTLWSSWPWWLLLWWPVHCVGTVSKINSGKYALGKTYSTVRWGSLAKTAREHPGGNGTSDFPNRSNFTQSFLEYVR